VVSRQAHDVDVRVQGYGDALPARADLITARFVLGGTIPAPYHSRFDQVALPGTLRRAGVEPVLRRRLSALNELVLWGPAHLRGSELAREPKRGPAIWPGPSLVLGGAGVTGAAQ